MNKGRMIAPLVVCFLFEEKNEGVSGLKLLERSRYVQTIRRLGWQKG